MWILDDKRDRVYVPIQNRTFRVIMQSQKHIDQLPLIRRAVSTDHARLTEIAFSSKNHWSYPPHYFTSWKDELTVTSDYIQDNTVFIHQQNSVSTGFYSLVELRKPIDMESFTLLPGLWLDHLFVDPPFIGCGIGTKLFQHAISRAKKTEHTRMKILSDPHSKEFYTKMGCFFVKDVPSSIPERTTPLLLAYFNA